ncbi:MAG: hypothetical protein Sv326_0076 [Candidatus Fermentimicrarchaeum limneticum]|uniref:AAA+ ATPase domain-containing protein n=1 Tax=Fermentimicrarchaeum limneticum TaxID=2795018 RepID=A0A7D5XC40_FERL1|nr:MAG: hypothetical protein Sv326_0076 [Candidatus Fermentimicrarchaeum limneticum]
MLGRVGSLFRGWGECDVWELRSIPTEDFDVHSLFVRKLKGLAFSVLYDFKKMRLLLITVDFPQGLVESIAASIPGLEFVKLDDRITFGELRNSFRYDGVPFKQTATIQEPFALHRDEMRRAVKSLLADLPLSFRDSDCYLLISFVPEGRDTLNEVKRQWEEELSKLSPVRREGLSIQSEAGQQRSQFTESTNYYDSDVAMVAAELLAMCNNALLHSDAVYRVSVVGWGDRAELLKQHLKGKYWGVYEKIRISEELRSCMPVGGGEVLSGEYATLFLHFAPEFAREETTVDIGEIPKGVLSKEGGGVEIGNELMKGVRKHRGVYLDKMSYNTNILIVGQQRMGKTMLAKRIAKHAAVEGAGVIVFSPSSEWSSLAKARKGMLVIKLAERVPFNLVRCPPGVRKEQFYQNLALLLANAMGAGPYTNPIRNVMLNSFTSLYSRNNEPGIADVYNGIHSSVVEFYSQEGGKSFGKFGQNIRASLENLRQLMLKEQFRVKDGVRIEDCIKNGAVFDLSECSELERALLYAFTLAQVYSYIMSNFDEKGDRELRLLIVLEEAHMVFRKQGREGVSVEATATADLERKLGMFGKRGVGMMLITHFADQLSDVVRRHAQTHFYFKQDVESLDSALKDLKFNPSDEKLWRSASAKLLSLPTGVAACRVVHIDKGSRIEVGPFFIKTIHDEEESLGEREIAGRIERYMSEKQIRMPEKVKLKVRVVSKEDGSGIGDVNVELLMCGAPVSFSETQDGVDYVTKRVDLDIAGSTYLDAVEGEEYELKVSKKGFRSECRKVVAGKDESIQIGLELSGKASRDKF